MSYDRDIRWGRRFAWCLLFANLVACVLNTLAHEWTVAIACLIWINNSALYLHWCAVQQTTRDLGRTLEAGLHAMRREMEHRE